MRDELDIERIDPDGRGEWTHNNSGEEVYYVPTGETGLTGRMYRKDGSSHDSYWNPAGHRCFVATAVYGTDDVEQINTLHDFRRNVLNESRLGRLAIRLYYSGLGEKAADFITKHAPGLASPIRNVLDNFVEGYREGASNEAK